MVLYDLVSRLTISLNQLCFAACMISLSAALKCSTQLRCVLVTYFDVRCAQRLMLSSLGRCEPFPPVFLGMDLQLINVRLLDFICVCSDNTVLHE